MSLIAIALAAALGAIAGLHGYWASGGVWPARDEAALVRMVVGQDWRRRMPGQGLSTTVALCLFGAAGVGLLLRWPGPLPGRLVAVAGFGLTAVFIARGLAGYTPAWHRSHAAEPFARLDRQIYSPLCLALGIGFASLAIFRWSAT